MTYLATNVFVHHLTCKLYDEKTDGLFHHLLQYDTVKSIKPAYHHQTGREMYPSGWRQYHSRPGGMGLDVWVLDGTAWDNIRRDFDEARAWKVLRLLANNSVGFTRVDLAMDFYDDGALAREFADLCYKDSLETGRRKAYIYSEKGRHGGTSTYIGARASAKMLRIYDKRAESRGKIPATRLEFELKHWYAEALTAELRGSDTLSKATSLYKGLLVDFLPGERLFGFIDILENNVHTLTPPKVERNQSRLEWLRRQVYPTFVENWDTGGSELFQTVVEEILAEVVAR